MGTIRNGSGAPVADRTGTMTGSSDRLKESIAVLSKLPIELRVGLEGSKSPSLPRVLVWNTIASRTHRLRVKPELSELCSENKVAAQVSELQ